MIAVQLLPRLEHAIRTGFFAINRRDFALLLGSLDLLASILWLCVNLGSKYWQSRWEQQLEDEEALLSTTFDKFFGVCQSERDKRV